MTCGTTKFSVRVDTLMDLLTEHGISITEEQAADVADDFAGHIEMEREMEAYQFMGPAPCRECEKKQKSIEELERKSQIYIDGLLKASRMPEDSYVSIENGRVFIERS